MSFDESMMNDLSIEEEKRETIPFSLKLTEVKGSNIFNLPNGDIYIGSYGVKDQNIIFRAGRGMYICSDKTVLLGDWEENNLVYGKIKFPNGDEYSGNFLSNSYEGQGRYNIPHVGSILCNFHKNAPKGQMTLVDVNGFTWRGETSENNAILYPVNQFIESPLFTEDISVPKTQTIDEELTIDEPSHKTSRSSLGPSTGSKHFKRHSGTKKASNFTNSN